MARIGILNRVAKKTSAENMTVIRSHDISCNVKEHATLSAGAGVDHGVEVETTGGHVNRADDRGCCVSTCWDSYYSVTLIVGINLSNLP